MRQIYPPQKMRQIYPPQSIPHPDKVSLRRDHQRHANAQKQQENLSSSWRFGVGATKGESKIPEQPCGGFFTIVAWRQADDLKVIVVYQIPGKFLRHALYGLTAQFPGPVDSVTAKFS